MNKDTRLNADYLNLYIILFICDFKFKKQYYIH